MRENRNPKEITNPTVARRVHLTKVLKCDRCPPHKGCNSWVKRRQHESWKKNRRKQWKVVDKTK